LLVSGVRSRDARTFFARRIIAFLPERHRRRFHAPLRKSDSDGCSVNGRLFSLLPPHGKHGYWILTSPSILEWKDDDELKLQWKQLMGSMDDLFVNGCFGSPSEYMGLRSVAEDSFVFPLVDAMYFKSLLSKLAFERRR